MNSDTEILIREILAESGAVTKCKICGNELILSDDEHAEGVAYALATNAWKDGERGFRRMDRKELMELVKLALINTPSRCSSCNKT